MQETSTDDKKVVFGVYTYQIHCLSNSASELCFRYYCNGSLPKMDLVHPTDHLPTCTWETIPFFGLLTLGEHPEEISP